MSYGTKRAGRRVEATNSGSLREPNSNAKMGRKRDSWARLFAGVWSRLVMNLALIGGRGSLLRGSEVGRIRSPRGGNQAFDFQH